MPYIITPEREQELIQSLNYETVQKWHQIALSDITKDENANILFSQEKKNAHNQEEKEQAVAILNNKSIMLAAIAQHPAALQFASEELRSSRLFLKQVSKENYEALEYANTQRLEKFFVMSDLVQQNASALKFASAKLRDNTKLVKQAVDKAPMVLQYASIRLQKQLLPSLMDNRLSAEETLKLMSALDPKTFTTETINHIRRQQGGEAIPSEFVDILVNKLGADAGLSLNAHEIAHHLLNNEQNDITKKSLQYWSKIREQEPSVPEYLMIHKENDAFWNIDDIEKASPRDLKPEELADYKLYVKQQQAQAEAILKSKEIILRFIAKDSRSIQYAPDTLSNDPLFLEEAVNRNHAVLRYIDQDNAKKIVEKLFKSDVTILQYADVNLGQDKKLIERIIVEAITQDKFFDCINSLPKNLKIPETLLDEHKIVRQIKEKHPIFSTEEMTTLLEKFKEKAGAILSNKQKVKHILENKNSPLKMLINEQSVRREINEQLSAAKTAFQGFIPNEWVEHPETQEHAINAIRRQIEKQVITPQEAIKKYRNVAIITAAVKQDLKLLSTLSPIDIQQKVMEQLLNESKSLKEIIEQNKDNPNILQIASKKDLKELAVPLLRSLKISERQLDQKLKDPEYKSGLLQSNKFLTSIFNNFPEAQRQLGKELLVHRARLNSDNHHDYVKYNNDRQITDALLTAVSHQKRPDLSKVLKEPCSTRAKKLTETTVLALFKAQHQAKDRVLTTQEQKLLPKLISQYIALHREELSGVVTAKKEMVETSIISLFTGTPQAQSEEKRNLMKKHRGIGAIIPGMMSKTETLICEYHAAIQEPMLSLEDGGRLTERQFRQAHPKRELSAKEEQLFEELMKQYNKLQDETPQTAVIMSKINIMEHTIRALLSKNPTTLKEQEVISAKERRGLGRMFSGASKTEELRIKTLDILEHGNNIQSFKTIKENILREKSGGTLAEEDPSQDTYSNN